MRTIITILHILFSSIILAQPAFHGIITDVVSNSPLDSVSINRLSNEEIGSTNDEGKFCVPTIYLDNSNLAKPHFVSNSSNENISLFFNEEVSAQLYSTSGKLIFESPKHTNELKITLSNSNLGICVLRVKNRKNEQNIYYILNQNNQVSIGLKSKPNSFANDKINDSITINRDNYYSRTIPITANTEFDTIHLLKHAYSELHYLNELQNQEAFAMLKGTYDFNFFSDVESVKLIYNTRTDKVYYMNTQQYPTHFEFASSVLNFLGNSSTFSNSQYRLNANRYLYPATLSFYKSINKYVLSFFPLDAIDCAGVELVYDKIINSNYIEKPVAVYCDKTALSSCGSYQIIKANELYNSQTYQALNKGETYGYLKKVDINTIQTNEIGKRDVVILNGLPNDMPVCKGIISNDYQTPLSHINVLSHNRGTPNMAFIDSWNNQTFSELMGKLVYLKVEADSFSIEEADYTKAAAFWASNEPQEDIVLNTNDSIRSLVSLEEADLNWVSSIGGKAANFSELMNISDQNTYAIPIPEGAFAIPFYFYNHHFNKSGAYEYYKLVCKQNDFMTNTNYRIACLDTLKTLIKTHAVDSTLLAIVNKQLKQYPHLETYRFRSSTNAEDVDEFSGAGLYSSYTAIVGATEKKTVEQAIKKVWASLWNIRAYDERDYYKVDQNSVSMGVLVHRSFPNEDANGVIITKNLYNTNHAFTINVQYGEYSIVYPGQGISHDQLLLYTKSYEANKRYSIQYFSNSNVPELNENTVLTEAELFQLGDYCLAIKNYYHEKYYSWIEYKNFALDIEFKLDSQFEHRKLYIKQVRIYN